VTSCSFAETAQDGKPQFRPVDVEVGDESAGMVEIRKLAAGIEGTRLGGNSLIDSEASLRSAVHATFR